MQNSEERKLGLVFRYQNVVDIDGRAAVEGKLYLFLHILIKGGSVGEEDGLKVRIGRKGSIQNPPRFRPPFRVNPY